MAIHLHAWLSLVASEAGAPFHRPTLRLLPLSLAVCSLVISYYLHMQWPHALNYDLESSYISLLLNSQRQWCMCMCIWIDVFVWLFMHWAPFSRTPMATPISTWDCFAQRSRSINWFEMLAPSAWKPQKTRCVGGDNGSSSDHPVHTNRARIKLHCMS